MTETFDANTIAIDLLRSFAPDSKSATEALEHVAQAEPEALAALLTQAVLVGADAGRLGEHPADDRLDVVGNALRQVHREEMFGDCVADGDHYPCMTIRALDLAGAGEPLPAPEL